MVEALKKTRGKKVVTKEEEIWRSTHTQHKRGQRNLHKEREKKEKEGGREGGKEGRTKRKGGKEREGKERGGTGKGKEKKKYSDSISQAV